jgi:hypothetical protein
MKNTMFVKILVSEKNPISLGIDNKKDTPGERKEQYGLNWLLFLPMLAITCSLLMPQACEFFAGY